MTSDRAFDALPLNPSLLEALAASGYAQMTLVQARALPDVLAGRDVLARAKTGSGKTAAFGLGLLNRLDVESFNTQALVLCPTRELADQVAAEVRRLARSMANVKILSVCGGVPFAAQVASLKHSPHVLVGTPGRVLKHLGKGTLAVNLLTTLVLDEADRLLDMGFSEELDAILEHLPGTRQTLLFSATYPDSVAEISERVQRQPVSIDVTGDERPAGVAQYWCQATQGDRQKVLLSALYAWGGGSNLVFCNTKADCAQLAGFLRQQKVAAVALHGDLEQVKRTLVLTQFANGSASVLVATDVAARGIDVDNIDVVFNYELPPQPEVYVHRIGRTARAGRNGTAVSLVTEYEFGRLVSIESAQPDTSVVERPIPRVSAAPDALQPAMRTLRIAGGRSKKLRPGDLLGALTAEGGVPGDAVGAIDVLHNVCYVAIRRDVFPQALQQLGRRPIKGRKYRASACD